MSARIPLPSPAVAWTLALVLAPAAGCKTIGAPSPDGGASRSPQGIEASGGVGGPRVPTARPATGGKAPRPPAAARPQRPPRVRSVPAGRLARFSRAVVSSLNPRASREAARVLAEGGTAIDAAVTATLMVAVMEPQATSLGGGGFLLHFDARTRKVRALDFRERAPRKAQRRMYFRKGKLRPGLARTGHLAVAVPGLVAGLREAHRKLGRLPWKRLVEPAITAARGFRVGRRMAQVARGRLRDLRRFPRAARIFLAGGKAPKVGHLVRRPELARTLSAIARGGARSFYQGEVAKRIAAEMRRGGGLIDEEDLRRYRPIWREPVRIPYRGTEVVAMPLPSAGGVVLSQALRMLSGDDLAKMPRGLRAHLIAEVLRRSFADRAEFLGDPAFVKVPLQRLLDPGYLRRRRAGIELRRAGSSKQVRPGRVSGPGSPNTTHLVVVDPEGSVVTLTHSTNFLFGSCVVVPGTGVLLNDTMDDFAIAPGQPNSYGLVGTEANAIAPGKTPLSSMTPTLVLRRGRPWLALGSPGGSTIISTVLEVLLNRVALGMDLKAAVAAPRWHHQWLPDRVMVEKSPGGEPIAGALRRRGHRVKMMSSIGNANAAEIAPDGIRLGVADPRRHGGVAGF